ncbi:transposase [Endozoicomonas sp. SCSIO W0465]|nr:transposase [Endozoicomonas sp. SCSIO W0465]USE35543.1 transposase [Endozoicomonas sp. SCSIO W0465]
MSEKKVKIYTAEFKESAVKMAVESDQPVTETARDLGVNVNTAYLDW